MASRHVWTLVGALASCIAILHPATAGATPITVTLQVSTGTDDYKETSTGSSQHGDTQHDLWVDVDKKQAVRFANFPVPRGASIVEARLQLWARDLLTAAIDGVAVGQAVGNAPAYTGADFEITNAAKTVANVPIQNLPAWTDNAFNDVADVAFIVQEIVNRPDYAAGNAVKIFLLANSTALKRRTVTYDSNPTRAPKLILTYVPHCPDTLELEPFNTLSSLDTGWTGQLHDGPSFPVGTKLTADVVGCDASAPPCGECDLVGPIANLAGTDLRTMRCTNNTAVECVGDERCFQQCAGGTNDGKACSVASDCPSGTCRTTGTCEFFFGGPEPLNVFGVAPLCVTNRVTGPLTGTANVNTGQAAINIPLATYFGPIPAQCPLCVGDTVRNDGLKNGTCSGGLRDGKRCDATSRSHAALGEASLDCPPTNDGTPSVTDIVSSTATITRTISAANPPCRANGYTGLRCACDTCNNAAATTCATNADCTAVGATICGGRRCLGGTNNGTPCSVASECPGAAVCNIPGAPSAPNQCDGGASDCVAGVCQSGPTDFHCTPSAPYVGCIFQSDCAGFKSCNGGSRIGEKCTNNSECPGGGCSPDSCNGFPRKCYTDGPSSVSALGSATTPADATWDVTLPALGCAAPGTAGDFLIGLPGLTRLELPLHLRGAPLPVVSLVIANYGQRNRLCIGNGDVRVACRDTDSATDDSADVAVVDVDANGKMDLVFANDSAQRNRVCINNGTGGFTCSDVEADASNRSAAVATGDFNGDGAPDLVFARQSGQRNRVCLGNGAGTFTCSDVSTDAGDSFGVATGHFNADGALDVVFARSFGETNLVCLGSGTGAFTCSNVSADGFDSADVAVGDVNADGKQDLVFANTERVPPANFHNRVCLGNGAGAFTCSDVSSDTFRSVGVALGDVNADGKLDAVFANFNQQRNRVCLGNGLGGFTCSDAGTDEHASADVVLVDFNRDGKLDAVFANASLPTNEKSRLCLGNGTGGFTCSDLSPEIKESRALAIGTFF